MSKKPKILLVVRWPVGGIRTYINYIFSHSEFSEYAVTIISPYDPEVIALKENLNPDVLENIIFTRDSTISLFIRCFIHLIFNRYQLVNSQGFTSGLCAAFISKLTFHKHLMTSHDVIRQDQFKGRFLFLKKLFLGCNFLLIDKIVSVTNDAENNLLEFVPLLKLRKRQLVTIFHGIKIENFTGDISFDLRKKLNLSDEHFLTGYFGRYMPQKGFMILVDAIKLLIDETPNLNIRVIAIGSGSYIREYQQYIQTNNVTDYFIFLPFEANIYKYLKSIDLITIPSLWEAAGLIGMEALISGVPTIGTDCIGLREVLADTPATIVATNNSQALANGILAHTIDNRVADFSAYVETAKKRFNLNTSAKNLKNLYISMI